MIGTDLISAYIYIYIYLLISHDFPVATNVPECCDDDMYSTYVVCISELVIEVLA